MTMIDTAQPSAPAWARLHDLGVRVAQRLSSWRARHAQRIALHALLELDPARLDDLGVTVQDIEDARVLGAPLRPPSRTEW